MEWTIRGSAGTDYRILATRKDACSSRRRGVSTAALPVAEQSGHARGVTPVGVMQPSAIVAADDCCYRDRSRSSRALLATGRASGGAGAHDGSATGCDSRAEGVAVTAGVPEFWPPYDGRLLTDDGGLAASPRPTDATAEASRRPSPLPFTGGRAPARVRISTALTPERSGAAEGVRDGRRPGPVQIDDGGRRGPFSGL